MHTVFIDRSYLTNIHLATFTLHKNVLKLKVRENILGIFMAYYHIGISNRLVSARISFQLMHALHREDEKRPLKLAQVFLFYLSADINENKKRF